MSNAAIHIISSERHRQYLADPELKFWQDKKLEIIERGGVAIIDGMRTFILSESAKKYTLILRSMYR